MIDTKLLRKETKLIAENLHKRGFIFEIKKWNQLETKRKELQKFNEEQQSKLNEISKEIGIKKNQKYLLRFNLMRNLKLIQILLKP